MKKQTTIKQQSENALPKYWMAAGSAPESYTFAKSKDVNYKGKFSVAIQSIVKDPKGFGVLVQDFSAEKYIGKRMKFSAVIKTDSVKGWAGLWMQVEGAGKDILGFDNMQGRKLTGNNDWEEYAVVLDVPKDARLIGFGILLSGEGKIWVSNVGFDSVAKTVAVTNIQNALPQAPQNLSFEE